MRTKAVGEGTVQLVVGSGWVRPNVANVAIGGEEVVEVKVRVLAVKNARIDWTSGAPNGYQSVLMRKASSLVCEAPQRSE